jgi:hypothetical protein
MMTRMWTRVLVALAVVAVLPVALDAQVTGGERPVQTATVRSDGPKGMTSLHFGTMSGRGDYGSAPRRTAGYYTTREAMQSFVATGTAASEGYWGEIARTSFLGLELPVAGLHLGIGGALSAGYQNFAWRDVLGAEPEESMGEAQLSFVLGPTIMYEPLERLQVLASLRFGVGMVGGSFADAYDVALPNGRRVSISDTHDEAGFGAARSFGLAARYSVFVVGWTMHSIGASRNRDYGVFDNNTGEMLADFYYTSDVPASTSRLYFGFAF